LGVHEVTPQMPPEAVHWACVVCVQIGERKWQHAPYTGHGFPNGPHKPDAGVMPGGHVLPVTIVHPPCGVQHVVIVMITKQKTDPHVCPGLTTEPAGQLCPMYTCVHPPVFGLQHAVTHGFGVHEPPCTQLPLHSDWIVMVQLTAPSRQHRPTGGHGPCVGVPRHELATDWIHPVGQEDALMKIWHRPVVTLQQTIVGGMHGVDGHGTPTPRNTPGVGHALALATGVHAPVA
jgi:hypothetical protein